MWLKANVPEVDIPMVKVGQDIEVSVTAIPNRVIRAKIIAIGAASDAATRRVMVRSEIPNPDGALKSEMFASFRIIVGDGEPQPSVPVEGVIREGEAAYVWVQLDSERFQRRRVQIGAERDGKLSVVAGLTENDSVIGRGAIFVDNQWRQ
jgi:cobalt-zinc-cadmium efflux system membrane fusion protein